MTGPVPFPAVGFLRQVGRRLFALDPFGQESTEIQRAGLEYVEKVAVHRKMLIESAVRRD